MLRPRSSAVASTDFAALFLMAQTGAALAVATTPNASNNCGEALSASAGTSTVTTTGGTIPAAVGGVPGACTIAVNVTAVTAGNHANTLPAGAPVTSADGNLAASTAALSVGLAAACYSAACTRSAQTPLVVCTVSSLEIRDSHGDTRTCGPNSPR